MLLQRVITAVVLLLLLIASLAAPGFAAFALLTLALLAAAGWEWARLNQAAQALGLPRTGLSVDPALQAWTDAWAQHRYVQL